eukprot:ANDGO_05435.mRNA.1 hypothetical protein
MSRYSQIQAELLARFVKEKREKTSFSEGALVIICPAPVNCTNSTLLNAFVPHGALQARICPEYGIAGVLFPSTDALRMCLMEYRPIQIKDHVIHANEIWEPESFDRVWFRRMRIPAIQYAPKDGSVVSIIDFEAALMIKKGFSIPLEAAVVQMKLWSTQSQPEIMRSLHFFIDPGFVPSEFQSQINFTRNHIHGIPMPAEHFANAAAGYGKDDGSEDLVYRTDYATMASQILHFFATSDVVIAKGRHTEERCLEWIADRGGLDPMAFSRILEYDVLLKQWSRASLSSPTEEMIQQSKELDSSSDLEDMNSSAYASNSMTCVIEDDDCHLGCDYHASLDGSFHCALNDVRIYSEIIARRWKKWNDGLRSAGDGL